MGELGQRMVDAGGEPDTRTVARWIGAANYRRWMGLLEFIEANYPGVFAPDWVYADSDRTVDDIERLLAIKRKPRRTPGGGIL